uniref:Replication protein A2 n=1 Tax=Neogobius melanostomus TaxID=47308 RepID=A0A8C6THU5_9GOBI
MWNQGGFADSSMGGGYTQSPGGFASPSLSQGGEKKARTRATQIIPYMCYSQTNPLFFVCVSTDKSMTNIQYKVDDMTSAPMDVKQWVDTEDPGVDSTVLPPGTYVKVSGNLRSFQNHRSVVAFSVRPLEDMNEVTSHMLEVVHAHMALCKPQTMTSAGGMNSSMASMSRTNMGSMGSVGSVGGSYSGANMVNNGLNASQNQVLSLIRSCPDQQGISIQDIKQRLSGMSINIIKQAVEFLSNEGHIFSTIDEDHYKSTDNDE